MQLNGTSALVTGGASGLGEAVARHLVQKGVKVAIFDRHEQRGELVSNEIGCTFVPVDISDDNAVGKAVDTAVSKAGIPRIVVNCAGLGAGGGLLSFSGAEQYERFDRVFKVNVYGTFSVMRHVMPYMKELEPLQLGERGVIVNTASISGYEGQAGQTVYSASKAAIIGLTLPAARDLSHLGIRVCAIAPGVFNTRMLGPSPALVESIVKDIPFPRGAADPGYFAALVGHICENPVLNGEVIRLDAAARVPPFNTDIAAS